jgi:thiol-disulfide isomerase/thioredoxin
MRNLFKSLVLTMLIAFNSISFSVQAHAEPISYTQAAFNQLQRDGKSILVVVYASWCPTCRAQAPIINELLAENEFKSITALLVDFDTQKNILYRLNVSKQSSLIVYKGGKEVARSTGDTSFLSIEKLLQKAI